MKFGIYDIEVHVLDSFRLDGGAMFGAVPKVLWSRSIAADENNRIPMVARILRLTTASERILVDVGLGRKWSEKEKGIYQIQYGDPRGIADRFPDTTDVILTHLHFDHGGGISRTGISGAPELELPGANIYLQTAHLALARSPNIRERASFLPSHVEPLSSARLHLVDGGAELFPGIFVSRSNGHTEGLQWLRICQNGKTIAFPSDLVPTSHHVPLPYAMGYDMSVRTVLKEKADFLTRAVKENWIVVFEHDADVEAGIIEEKTEGKYSLKRSGTLQELVSGV